MASDQELSLTWFSICEEVLSKISGVDAFYDAIKIWVERPQVLNRRLVGSYIIQSFLTAKCSDMFTKLLTMKETILREDMFSLIERCKEENKGIDKDVVEVKIRSLLPRESSKYCNVLELVIQDTNKRSVTFIPFEEEESTNKLRCNIEHAYQVSFAENKNNVQSLYLSVADRRMKGNGITCPTIEWLKSTLMPKLHKWIIEDGGTSSLGQSLKLVSVEKYSKKYEELKKKYKHFVKMWPERTDPHKFVYEDVAIATYLTLLWEEKETNGKNFTPQKFVDLGCGNGLLVHILNNEGHLGKGVDLRSRKVWEFYDSNTVLEVTSLDPSLLTYPDVDWLIGNHSDELTPWIPVIAARSSYCCKYFVLPCCFHDFYCKFQRACSNERQYRSYLDYVEDVGNICGFDVEDDVLRIPSTKRVCQVGRNRSYPVEKQQSIEEEISSMLKNARYGKQNNLRNFNDHSTEKLPQTYTNISSSYHHGNTLTDFPQTSLNQSQALKQFVPRSNTEPVKNCTKLDKQLLDKIVQKVATVLLSKQTEGETIECQEGDGSMTSKVWNKGGYMELSEVSELFDQHVLSQLRCEAGGIKTVLRNSHQIFKVQGGRVEIRDWRKDSHCKKDVNKKQPTTQKYWKTKLCWFHDNHPDGCPLACQECSFAHGMEELRIP